MTIHGIHPQAALLLGWSALPVVLATAGVVLRFIARHSTRSTGWDDWSCLIALLLYYGWYTSLVLWGTIGSWCWPQGQLSAKQLERFFLIFWVIQLWYGAVTSTFKLSFLLLYRRLFVTRWLRRATIVVGALVASQYVSMAVVMLLECVPIGSVWQFDRRVHCLDFQKFYWAHGISNFLLACTVLVLPIPVIWHLHITLTQKIFVTCIFSLGFLSTVASIVRITSLFYVQFDNISGTAGIAGIWTSYETGLGIFCSCLPTLPALFKRWRTSIKDSWHDSYGQRLYLNIARSSLFTTPLSLWKTGRESTQPESIHRPKHDLNKFIMFGGNGKAEQGVIHVSYEYTVEHI